MQTLEGLFAPLVTSFTDDASTLSEVRFARQIRFLQAKPVDGFAIATDTGEFPSLASSERKQLVEWVARMGGGKPFLVHVSSLSTSTSLDLAQHAARHGARAAICMPPYYGDYTAEEIIAFFRTIVQYSNLPVIAVDPSGLITDDAKIALRQIPELVFAQPLDSVHQSELSCHLGPTASDEFAVGQCLCTPLALLAPEQVSQALAGGSVDLAKLIILEQTMGRARVAKAGMDALGIESGPPRSPVRPLSGSVEAALKTMLSRPE